MGKSSHSEGALAALIDLPLPPRLDALEAKVKEIRAERDRVRDLRSRMLAPPAGERADPGMARLYGPRLQDLELELKRYSALLDMARELLQSRIEAKL